MPRAPPSWREPRSPQAFGDWTELVENAGCRRDRHRHASRAAAARSPCARSNAASRCSPKSRWRATSRARARCCRQAAASGRPTMIDFNFTEIMAWRNAKALLDAVRSAAAPCHGELERREPRPLQMRHATTGKPCGDDGGGVLGNFVSHCFHYLEWFCGPIAGLSARLSGLPERRRAGNHGADGAAVSGSGARQPVA